ncbi:hypothetical protein DRE_02677 [Drechslerella stenobrocha 248]|uniref:Response regulatory domain-containing protein n=1 Tax=Drechslerella stenobrocha 248 TaxID=1043628 RepID=W7I718_9PEZI|nr:hypothetical protein DRE_02677 [Drechslerella stenobrocha 248]
MLLWKAAATKLRAVRGMRGFRDKIKGTKTKLLRRDSKDSTEDAPAIRPVKAAKADGAAGDGSWASPPPAAALDTNEPETPTFADSAANGDIVIEGGSAPKRRSGDCHSLAPGLVQPQQEQHEQHEQERREQHQKQPQQQQKQQQQEQQQEQEHLHAQSPASPILETTTTTDTTTTTTTTATSATTAPAAIATDIGPVTIVAAPDPPADALGREIPAVLVQKDTSEPESGLPDVVEGPQLPAQLPQKPLAENENLQPHPKSNATITISIPPTPLHVAPAESASPLTAVTVVSLSDKRTLSDLSPAAALSARPTLSGRSSADPLRVNTTNLPPPIRPYRLSQYPTDSSGFRTDTDTSNFAQLRRASSRTSLSTNEHGGQELPEPSDHDKREHIALPLPNGQDPLAYTSSPLSQPPETVPVPLTVEAIQSLHTVSETAAFQTNELNRNESVKSNRPTLITSSGSRRKPVLSFSRRQSLIHSSETGLLRSLLDQETASPAGSTNIQLVAVPMPHNENQVRTRRVWVKRPGGSPTQVVIAEDDFVDTVRDLCLRKYSNALGRQYDSPDLMIRIFPPAKPHSARTRQMGTAPPNVDRVLLPDEILSGLLDDYYPSGQTSEDALVIEVPPQQRSRTPRPSPGPHAMSYAYGQTVHDLQLPGEDYFTPIGITPHSQPGTVRSAHTLPPNPSSLSNYMANSPPPSSPGHRSIKRPGPVRMTTGSPVGSTNGSVQGTSGGVMLIPRAGGGGADRARTNAEGPQSPPVQPQMVALPSSPGPVKPAPQKPASPGALAPAAPPTTVTKPHKTKETIPASIGTLDGQVPSINVLIVEDNIINLRLLEAFMKRLKVRWAAAMNGRDAVTKWRTGGFQLVLMDIQLPIMNGLDATKEIRRLERLNSIGPFPTHPESPKETLSGEDQLDKSLVFKGSVIIVALTASSLQSDREEALAVGCNDFLTKPVNFTFLERKVMEWGCMQALIDFEGWRKWKDLANKPGAMGGKSTKGSGLGKANSIVRGKGAKSTQGTPSPSSSPTPRPPTSNEHS